MTIPPGFGDSLAKPGRNLPIGIYRSNRMSLEGQRTERSSGEMWRARRGLRASAEPADVRYCFRMVNCHSRQVLGPGIPSAWATGGNAAGTLWFVHPPRSVLI